MMKRISMFLMAVLLTGALAHAGKASIEGTVQKIDKSSITLQVGSEQKTFAYSPKVKFTVNGKTPSSVTVRPGDQVSIDADNKGVAVKVDVVSEGGAKAGSSN